jgi:hypothetical protein
MLGNGESHMNRARLAVVAATLLVSYAYFFQSGGWNQNSRFDLTRAIVEQRMLRIDSYHKNTGDKAFFGGHFYSTKAPGLAFAAVPVVAAARPFVRAAGLEPSSPEGVDALLYLATVVTLALNGGRGGLLIQVALTLRASVGGGAFAAIAFGSPHRSGATPHCSAGLHSRQHAWFSRSRRL